MKKPSQEYTIHILKDSEFDLLPFPDAKNAMGMSIVDRKTAYVRETGVRGMDFGTINHEFDELMASTSLHEEDGIRYKKPRDFFRSIFNIIPGLGNNIFGNAPVPDQHVVFDNQPQQNFNPTAATSAFSPNQAGLSNASPLSAMEFQTGLSNIDRNRLGQRANVFSQFRGMGAPTQNTAFSKALTGVDTGTESTRQQFIADQDQRKKLAGLM